MTKTPFYTPRFRVSDYIKAIVWGILISLLAIAVQLVAVEGRPLLSLFSNATLVAGGIQLARALFSYINKEGFFDVMGLGFKQLWFAIENSFRGTRDLEYTPDLETYRREKAPKRRFNLPWLVSGLIFLAISIILAIVFMNLY